MDTAVVGLLGVIAGAVVTGGIQAVGAYFSRRRHMRVAARALFSAAVEAAASVRAALSQKDIVGLDWDRFEVAWTEHRDSLALALRTRDFMRVSTFFLFLRQVADFKQLELDEGRSDPDAESPSGTSALHTIAEMTPDVVLLLWNASFTFLERQNGDHLPLPTRERVGQIISGSQPE